MLLRSSGLLRKSRRDFKHHVILIQLREHGRDLALAEGVVERVVDLLHADAQARSRIAIDDQRGFEPAVLLVGRDIAQVRQACCSLSTKRLAQVRKFFGVGIFERVLVLRPADAVFDGEILHRLHVKRDAFDLRQFGLQAADDVAGAGCCAGRAASD